MSSVGCSLGLTLGGMGALYKVGSGSTADLGTSTSDVPSCVQKVSHSSVNSWLHLGQRLIFLECADLSALWSAARWRRNLQVIPFAQSRDRSRRTKALTGQRT